MSKSCGRTPKTKFDNKVFFDGRLAFYLKGKIRGDILLTAAADTREQPVKNLFSNFTSKDPRFLLRRLDPEKYYPVYGDDSTTVDDAPTQGKFYVRLEKRATAMSCGVISTRRSTAPSSCSSGVVFMAAS